MKDIIMKQYELNEKYHDTKEKMAWLAVSLYAAFSMTLISWFFNKDYEINEPVFVAFIFVVQAVVFYCALRFIIFQYNKKRCSVKIEEYLEGTLSKKDFNLEEELQKFFEYKKEINKAGVKISDPKYRSTEVPILILLSIFFVSQIGFISVRFLQSWS